MQKMNFEKLKNNCTGCGACILICPTKSITLKQNQEGFYYIDIHLPTCIHCKLCEKRCPQNHFVPNRTIQNSYAAIGKNNIRTSKSSSGGIFITIADWIIENNGIVFGTIFNKHFEAVQVSAITKKDLIPMQGSKYVQSLTNHVYEDIADSLNKYKHVLYIGTPCQIAGLYAVLSEIPDHLYTVDLICHGVPSPQLFQNYIHWLEKQKSQTIKAYSFRNKSIWNRTGFICKIVFQQKTIKWDALQDPYYLSFLQGINFRECCYKCKYANLNRVGDITIGDLDGIDQVCPDFYPWKAVSTVLLNSKKARKLWKEVRPFFHYQKIDIDEESKYNHQLIAPMKRPKERDHYYDHYNDEHFFQELIQKNIKKEVFTPKKYIKKWLPVRLKYNIKVFIKKLR